tara:strand:- start:893 stop:1264 length:372 start_codon:yes stop_codon:yes gene_type:complete
LQDILLVTLGSVLGANFRFIIYEKLEKLNLRKDFIILIINSFSSFFLGFFISILSHFSSLNFSEKLVLFFSIGFLGSLSTFSTFIYDLFDLVLKLNFFRAFNLLIFSLSLGIVSLAFGFLLGN